MPKRLPPNPFDAIGSRAGASARRRRSIVLSLVAGACALAALAALLAHSSSQSHQRAQGAREADAAASEARRAMGFWTPERGYAPLAGRVVAGVSEWGAHQRLEALAGGAGVSVEYAHATRAQCSGLVDAAAAFFDAIVVDGAVAKAPGAPAQPGSAACSAMGQNAVRLAKIDEREGGVPAPPLSEAPSMAPATR